MLQVGGMASTVGRTLASVWGLRYPRGTTATHGIPKLFVLVRQVGGKHSTCEGAHESKQVLQLCRFPSCDVPHAHPLPALTSPFPRVLAPKRLATLPSRACPQPLVALSHLYCTCTGLVAILLCSPAPSPPFSDLTPTQHNLRCALDPPTTGQLHSTSPFAHAIQQAASNTLNLRHNRHAT